MLARRIIPTILCRGRQLVKGVGFDSWRTVGLAAQAVRIHAMRGVDEVVLLDIGATAEGRGPDLALVEELSEVLFAPLAVGGGVRSLEDVRALLRAGADKVVIGSRAFDLIREAREVVGAQALVASLDYRGLVPYIHNGRSPVYCVTPVTYAQQLASRGAGEILLQSIERDGAMTGYDLHMIKAVSEAVDVPVIASGGAGCYDHMREALEAGASAVAAGAMFQFTDLTPKGAAQYLNKKGVEVRL